MGGATCTEDKTITQQLYHATHAHSPVVPSVSIFEWHREKRKQPLDQLVVLYLNTIWMWVSENPFLILKSAPEWLNCVNNEIPVIYACYLYSLDGSFARLLSFLVETVLSSVESPVSSIPCRSPSIIFCLSSSSLINCSRRKTWIKKKSSGKSFLSVISDFKVHVNRV